MAFVEEIVSQFRSSNTNSDDNFIKSFLTERPVDSLLKTYEKIEILLQRKMPESVSLNAKADATEAYDHLRCHHFIPEAEELVRLLARVHMKSLIQCHDSIANKHYEPILPEIPYEVDEDDVAVKIVNLVKHNEPLGATIKINDRNGAVLVARVMHGGAADRSNALDVGDEIQEINNFTVNGRDPMEVIKMLTSISGDVKLKLFPSNHRKNLPDQNQGHVRALFSYSPSMDMLIPCREAGLAFRRGDILRLVNTEDPHWWQAVKVESGLPLGLATSNSAVNTGTGKAGLIPSRALQHMKEHYKETGATNLAQKGKELPSAPTPVKDYQFYEEVDKYFAEEGSYRAVILIGPSGVGKNELKLQLCATHPEHFKEPIRITTRDPLPNEVHGRDYLFVTKEEFETFQQAESLIDQYESSGESYGLCLEAVLDVIQAGQVAVFSLQPQYLIQARHHSIKPYIVYIKPPNLDVLLETRPLSEDINDLTSEEEDSNDESFDAVAQSSKKSSTRWSHKAKQNSTFSKFELKDMLQCSQRLELSYGHYFDHVIVNDDLPVALEQLSDLAYRLETEPFWVPKRWLMEDSSAASSSI